MTARPRPTVCASPTCATTGDPYFLRLEDGVIVRVPHDALRGEDLDLDQVERVAASIEKLIEAAEAGTP